MSCHITFKKTSTCSSQVSHMWVTSGLFCGSNGSTGACNPLSILHVTLSMFLSSSQIARQLYSYIQLIATGRLWYYQVHQQQLIIAERCFPAPKRVQKRGSIVGKQHTLLCYSKLLETLKINAWRWEAINQQIAIASYKVLNDILFIQLYSQSKTMHVALLCSQLITAHALHL